MLGKDSVFLIQNMFPTVEKYVKEKYVNSDIDVEVSSDVSERIIRIAYRVLRLAQEGIHIPFYNVIEMKDFLLGLNK